MRVWRGSPATFLSLLLAFTSATAGLFLTGRSAANPQLSGLHKLMAAMQLVQAFQGDPDRSPPQLWNRRFGIKLALSLWRRLDRGIWWQAWTADGQTYLVLPQSLLDSTTSSGLSLRRIDGLVSVSADALHQKQLDQRLASIGLGTGHANPLQASCVRRLATAPSVQWKPDALARLSGALSPLLQQAGYGCLTLRIQTNHLQWQGWVGSRDFTSAPHNLLVPERFQVPDLSPGLSDRLPGKTRSSPLLTIEGQSLGTLLSALASRQLVREPLEQTYGFKAIQREQLLKAPFRLQLLPQSNPEFQAALQLQLWPAAGPDSLQASFKVLQSHFSQLGLRQAKGEGVVWSSAKVGANPKDHAVLGGWRWLDVDSRQPLLSVGLGREPAATVVPALDPAGADPNQWLRLRGIPAEMSQRQLLGGAWPRAIRQSPNLELRMIRLGGSRSSDEWMELRGQLALASAP